MATHMPAGSLGASHASGATNSAVTADLKSPVYQAYKVLHLGYAALPVLAGLDKFFHLLADWDRYLAPAVPSLLHVSAHTFMRAVGVIEIAAGLIVALKPRIGAYVVSAWLLAIIGNLVLTGGSFDVALRDFGLSLGALALARLSHVFDRAGEAKEGAA